MVCTHTSHHSSPDKAFVVRRKGVSTHTWAAQRSAEVAEAVDAAVVAAAEAAAAAVGMTAPTMYAACPGFG